MAENPKEKFPNERLRESPMKLLTTVVLGLAALLLTLGVGTGLFPGRFMVMDFLGIGDPPPSVDYPLTARELDRMPGKWAWTLEECQKRKVARDKGWPAAREYIWERWGKVVVNTERDVPPLQVLLARDGYTCSAEEMARFRGPVD